jgi:hypothetical protein
MFLLLRNVLRVLVCSTDCRNACSGWLTVRLRPASAANGNMSPDFHTIGCKEGAKPRPVMVKDELRPAVSGQALSGPITRAAASFLTLYA